MNAELPEHERFIAQQRRRSALMLAGLAIPVIAVGCYLMWMALQGGGGTGGGRAAMMRAAREAATGASAPEAPVNPLFLGAAFGVLAVGAGIFVGGIWRLTRASKTITVETDDGLDDAISAFVGTQQDDDIHDPSDDEPASKLDVKRMIRDSMGR